ncbi:MAG: decarboxylating 6-phosphogluconate dehydrogenase [Gammaproteobacteria bacterium]|nr:decarboxylating 6-phosphogluconate dehydrogenase [Gammaproteobacteria bacterium]MDH3375158.1 decarboxylating 6-phosphogluconate dehydrogenase [Gammaproteobacteria bacterium]MDH3409329.1 decarboxylating 6-phosphogluconate dehydrogenase [Gammaproteobacteria bacterium]
MRLGLIGLGKMGANMARRLRRAGIEVAGFNRDAGTTRALAAECGLLPAESTKSLVAMLDAPRLVWLMLPAGDVTEDYVQQLSELFQPGDILIDGANSYYKDSVRRGELLANAGIFFVDAGVSGGVWGLENGYALMLGGTKDAFAKLRPIVEALAPAPDRGWIHTGPVGSGHFVKMIHNGIEYGMMQAYAEGFALMKGRDDFGLDLAGIAEAWRHGSVVRSWLLDLSANVLAKDQQLDDVQPFVADSGEGRWTALEGIEQGIPTPVMSLALMVRFATQGNQDYSAKLLAMMRNQFGGHAIRSSNE